MDGSEGITKELARAQFTEEMLAEMRALIGTQLRTEACLNNEYATRLAIQRFCEGIGDVVRLGGRVEAKKVDADGDHVVRLKTWAYNQREQNVMPGTASIVLPMRPNTQ